MRCYYGYSTPCQRCFNLGIRSGVMWILAISSWASDRLMCHVWESLSFQYLHGFWHIFILLASYTVCVLFAYFDAVAEVPQLLPELRFWPNNEWELLGIPYVAFRNERVLNAKVC